MSEERQNQAAPPAEPYVSPLENGGREGLPLTPGRNERERQIETAIHARIDAIAKAHEDRVLDGITQMISRHEQARVPDVLQTVDKDGNATHRTGVPYAREYRELHQHLSPWERQFRTPDSDHWMRTFVVAAVTNNSPQMELARAKLDQLFPDMARADTLEGAADAAGGFAAGTGGVLMPRVLEELVAVNRDRTAKMWRWATTYQMTAQEHNIPTGNAMTGFMVGEATSPITQGEPVFAQVPLIAFRGAAKAIMGNDLMEDAAVNVVNFITMRGGAVLGALEDTQFLQGGTITADLGGLAFAETPANTLKYSDVVSMFTNVRQEYRPGSRWIVASDVLGFMANVRDGQGRPFYSSLLEPPMIMTDSADGSPGQGAQGTLLGYPVHEANLPDGEIYFGNVGANYAIGRRHGIRVDVSREFYFDTFRTIFLIHQRFAGNNIDNTAGQHATGIAAATST